MRRLTQVALMGVLVLGVASLATAQETPKPVVRLGNFLEVGNDVFLKIIATGEVRYNTAENNDFESRVRDRAHSRNPDDNTAMDVENDAANAQLQLGVDVRYQKSLQLYLLFRHHAIFDGNTIDDRANCTNPGGTDVFGRGPSPENPGFRAERYWIDYKFVGTPLRLRVGADLWNVDQAGIVGDDDPRLAVFGEFGNFDLMGAAVIQYESQRIGLENDNDIIYYTFSAGYNFKPHRAQLDVVYFRDRFSGADLFVPRTTGGGIGFPGQKQDAVLIIGSWSGKVGPIRALVQGNLMTGTARGVTGGFTNAAQLAGFRAVPGFRIGKDYDIFSGGVVAAVEADLGVVKPFATFFFGSGDGDPRDNKLQGFNPAVWTDVTQFTGLSYFNYLDRSPAGGWRDYACPGRLGSTAAGATPLRNPTASTPGNLGVNALGTTGGGSGCVHSVTNPFNNLLANQSHAGINTPLSNPGTLLISGGLKVYPVKGHEIVGWYVYRGMMSSTLLNVAFAPQLPRGQSIGKGIYHEVGGTYMWTLNPHFDIRLAGMVGFAANGWQDLAELASCGTRACEGDDVSLHGEVRFRARF